MSPTLPSRVDTVNFRGRSFYIKRDDLIDPCLSGNKYRKLYTLTQLPSNTYTKVISYGGGQSNAMLSIACLCRAKGWEFHYYTKSLPSYLKENLEGNLAQAVSLGMVLHEVTHDNYEAKVSELKSLDEKETLVISQGGADEVASLGIEVLAEEINLWKKENQLEKLIVVLPSGTGSTSLYLKAFLEEDIELYTVVLVGDEDFQLEQWKRLSNGPYPKILPSAKKKFAKPYDEYLEMYTELKQEMNIEFDLIYAPKTWIKISEQLLDEKAEILYIHTGGVSGNATMLARYEHKGRR